METDDVRLDGVAAESLARARRNAPGIHFDATLAPTVVDGVPERLARAINNLLDNAARHSPPGGTVELGRSQWRRGPRSRRRRGPDDLPYVFDRFFRGTNSRGLQGSGLGLSIVRQVAEQHGGSASVTNAVDGGAIFTLHLPGMPAENGEPVAQVGDVAALAEPCRALRRAVDSGARVRIRATRACRAMRKRLRSARTARRRSGPRPGPGRRAGSA